MELGSDYLTWAHITETGNRPLRTTPEKLVAMDERRIDFRDGFSDGRDQRNRLPSDPLFDGRFLCYSPSALEATIDQISFRSSL